ncbi:DUF2795 domain-containing protein [Actinophytocola xanthii]|uniref:DUF2795 domain-containing protein n=1 Tax=Actinophytocola xanthii TaxID=1912961 RepID=A0A1Q8CSB7_9PSEU|nr:DUF2795 domain-containing protein [Actinophytocola xanthii]OLF17248.1 hypothetical protein BU204_12735 [Actinophytocola xanthii]
MVATRPELLREALSSADFPADKDTLVRYAEQAGADEDTIRAIRAIPPVSYANLAEVTQSVTFEGDQSPAERAARQRANVPPGLAEAERDVPPHPIAEEKRR